MSTSQRQAEGQPPAQEEYDGESALEFLRATYEALMPSSKPFPFDRAHRIEDIIAAPKQVLRVLHEVVHAFLVARGGDPPVELEPHVVDQNPSLALQTSLIALEDAVEVELGFVQVSRIAGGSVEEVINLCETLQTLFTSVGEMDAARRQHEQQQEQSNEAQQQSKKAPSKKKNAAGDFGAFSQSGIQTKNPFQSDKAEIYGLGKKKSAVGKSMDPKDTWAEREALRVRESQDEKAFQERYERAALGSDTPSGSASGSTEGRTDDDYAFLRSRTHLPMGKLSRAQEATARELSFERDGTTAAAEPYISATGEPRSSPFRTRPGLGEGAPSISAFAEKPGQKLEGVNLAAKASDEHMMETIEYLESFLSRAKGKARAQAGMSVLDRDERPWKEELRKLGGPDAIGRRAAWEEEAAADSLRGRRRTSGSARGATLSGSASARSFSLSPSPSHRYAAPTVFSSPWGRANIGSPSAASTSRLAGSASSRRVLGVGEEMELQRLEAEVAHLRRQAVASHQQTQAARERERLVDLAFENIRDRREIEESIALLKDYTQGRPLPKTLESRADTLAREMRESVFGPSPPRAHMTQQRIPTGHPHRTGKNHHPKECVYCRREVDWHAWNTKAVDLMDQHFDGKLSSPSRSPAQQRAADARDVGFSRLRPLAKKLLQQSGELSSTANISRDFTGHFLGQLSAAERRAATRRLDSLWTIVANVEADKHAQLQRISREIEEEAFRRTVHLKWIEEQAIERALGVTMKDKQQEREVQKLVQDQARHVSHLLELKRQSLANYTRDQCDLLSERYRVERETAKLRAQNDKHSRRELERNMRDAAEAMREKKLNAIRHGEEKFAFRLSELRRPPYSEGGIADLRYWKQGRN